MAERAARRRPASLTSAYNAGITTSVSTVEDTIPPTIEAAMRRITSNSRREDVIPNPDSARVHLLIINI